MICPHCGMNTGNSEKCVHCSGNTEFARRSKVRPERIPNINDSCPDILAQLPSTIHTKGIILAATVIIAVFAVAASIFFAIRYKQLLSVENAAEVMTEYTEESVLSTEQEPLIYLYSICDAQGEQDLLTTITVGENIPVFPDSEDHIFTGWNTEQDGTGMAFRAGDPFMIHIAEDVSLYAQWEIKPKETAPVASAIEDTIIPESSAEETVEVMDETIPQSTEAEVSTTDLDNGVNTNE